MTTRTLALTLATASMLTLGYLTTAETHTHAACIHRATVRILARTHYPETVDARAQRLCALVP